MLMLDGPKQADKAPLKVARALGGCLGMGVSLTVSLGGIASAIWALTLGGSPLWSINFCFGSVATHGTVVKVQDVGEGHWSPVVAYEVDGKSYTIRGWAGSQRRSRWVVGEKVRVLYMHDQHDLGQIDSFFDRWYYPSAIIVIGVCLVAGGLMVGALAEHKSRLHTAADDESFPKPAADAPLQGALSVAAAFLMIFGGVLCLGLGVVTCIELETWLAIVPLGGVGLMFLVIGVATLRYRSFQSKQLPQRFQ